MMNEELLERLLEEVGKINIPGYFITAIPADSQESLPVDLHSFLSEKAAVIAGGSKARRFVYRKNKWCIYFTFFPTDSVVDERYALKNKVLFRY